MPKSRALKETMMPEMKKKPMSPKEMAKQMHKEAKEDMMYAQENMMKAKMKMMGAKAMMKNMPMKMEE